jgi:hypothetical protein
MHTLRAYVHQGSDHPCQKITRANPQIRLKRPDEKYWGYFLCYSKNSGSGFLPNGRAKRADLSAKAQAVAPDMIWGCPGRKAFDAPSYYPRPYELPYGHPNKQPAKEPKDQSRSVPVPCCPHVSQIVVHNTLHVCSMFFQTGPRILRADRASSSEGLGNPSGSPSISIHPCKAYTKTR